MGMVLQMYAPVKNFPVVEYAYFGMKITLHYSFD